MTQAQTNELDTLVDDELVEAIQRHQQLQAEIESAEAKRDAAREAAKQHQAEVDALVARATDAWGKWQDRLREHDGVVAILDGIAYVPQGEEADTRGVSSNGTENRRKGPSAVCPLAGRLV
jgi:hypothetical protein